MSRRAEGGFQASWRASSRGLELSFKGPERQLQTVSWLFLAACKKKKDSVTEYFQVAKNYAVTLSLKTISSLSSPWKGKVRRGWYPQQEIINLLIGHPLLRLPFPRGGYQLPLQHIVPYSSHPTNNPPAAKKLLCYAVFKKELRCL